MRLNASYVACMLLKKGNMILATNLMFPTESHRENESYRRFRIALDLTLDSVTIEWAEKLARVGFASVKCNDSRVIDSGLFF